MQISLYKTIDEELLNFVDVETPLPIFSYIKEKEDLEEYIEFNNSDFSNEFVINEADPEWSPIEHNLILKQNFYINHTEKLFGENGVTDRLNKLGIACHVYSKTSNFQKTLHVSDIRYKEGTTNISFEHIFNENTLGGVVFLDFFIYLKEHKISSVNHAEFLGTNLMTTDLLSYSLIIDGSGSEFPIVEINDSNKPLWSVEFNWTDIYEDLFNASSVRLILNQAHPLFDQLMNQRYRVNQYLMNDIIINAMAMIIQKVYLIEQYNLEEETDFQPGSIAQIVWYWVSTYEVNLDSLETIANSIRKNTDAFIEED